MCRNNAGLSLNDAPRQTKDGLEMMFAVNFIGEYFSTFSLKHSKPKWDPNISKIIIVAADSSKLRNCSGHYALTNLLLDTMRSTAKDSGIQGRIVIVSGGVYAKFTPPGGIIFEQLVGSKK